MMHLLAAQAGALQQDGEAIDLGQSPGDIVFASAADSELAMLAAALDRAGQARASGQREESSGLRLANILRLAHNLSIDLWLENTVRHAKLVVVRLLGGPSYWQYGVDELTALAAAGGASNAASLPSPQGGGAGGGGHRTGRTHLVFLPGDANPDPILQQRSTVHPDDWSRLHALFVAGGPENADTILAAFHLLSGASSPLPLRERVAAQRPGEGLLANLTPKPFARFGLWYPGRGIVTVTTEGLEGERSTPTPDPSPQGGGVRDIILRVPPSQSPFGGAGHLLPLEGRGRGGGSAPSTDSGNNEEQPASPNIPILFYRAALEGAGTATLEALIAELESQRLNPVPFLVSSLKEQPCVRFVRSTLKAFPPSAILNLTGFALGLDGLDDKQNPFAETDAPVIQLVQGGRPEALWAADSQGLSPKDLAMQIVLPEMDGRIGGIVVGHKQEGVWHAATQCPLSAYAPDVSGIIRAVTLAKNWSTLRATPRADRKVAIVLANYPIRDGRLANGVGYDAPQSTVEILQTLSEAGYNLRTEHATASPSPLRGGVRGGGSAPSLKAHTIPTNGNALIDLLQSGPTNADPRRGQSPAILPLARYRELLKTLPEKIQSEVANRWGDPTADPFVRTAGGEGSLVFHLPVLVFGNVAILLQPARGYHLDDTASYHDPDLVPPHAYLAAYLWLRHEFDAHALIHNGKHGNLEWLPGKATALDAASYSDALWGQLPHLYPFIVNDPGEGTQAKRRTGAVIIDHLVPPLTRAETYGPLKDLEALLDEYYAASGMDRRRLKDLRKRILDFARDERLDRDVALPSDETEALKTLDTFLCDLKEAQIRDGLHIFGQSPKGDLERDLIVALARVPRGEGAGDASLIRTLADDLKLGFDPLTADLGAPWTGPSLVLAAPTPSPSPQGGGEPSPLSNILQQVTGGATSPPSPLRGGAGGGGHRTVGDIVEHLESLAADLVDGLAPPPGPATATVLDTIETIIRPRLAASGPAETKALLDGLDGKFIPPGPSGAPSRGRLDVLPTGRNFYSVDNRAVPTPTAWELGKKSAENLLIRHFQDHGNPLRALALSVWGTANMRTGGDDIAQALAFIGARPRWDPSSLRVSGYEIIPLAKLGRPRVDVTLRISGFFRDAFPAQITLFDRAIRAIGALDEPESENPIAARMRSEALGLMAAGETERNAALKAGYRVFGSKPGAYGAGLQGLVDGGNWHTKSDLAGAFLNWGQYAYGQKDVAPERARFAARLSEIEAVVHNQDNREHDLLDSDDYYQFEGGLLATAEALTERRPAAYHNDHSRPERPLTRTLEEEISRVMRSRVVNPKWIDGVKRHGYKGAFEIIATVDYMFAFAATTGAVKTHHFDLAFSAFVEDAGTREFIQQNNRFGYHELIAKFNEAMSRGLWTPRSNSAHALLTETAKK